MQPPSQLYRFETDVDLRSLEPGILLVALEGFMDAGRTQGLLVESVEPLGGVQRDLCDVIGDVDVDHAYQHARLTGINLLAVLHDTLGDLSRVKRVVKLLGMVNAVPLFADHPKVINGCSDLFIDVFGEADELHMTNPRRGPTEPSGAIRFRSAPRPNVLPMPSSGTTGSSSPEDIELRTPRAGAFGEV